MGSVLHWDEVGEAAPWAMRDVNWSRPIGKAPDEVALGDGEVLDAAAMVDHTAGMRIAADASGARSKPSSS